MQLFSPACRVPDAFGDNMPFERATELMGVWHRHNRELTADGRPPDRLLHLDLVSLNRRA